MRLRRRDLLRPFAAIVVAAVLVTGAAGCGGDGGGLSLVSADRTTALITAGQTMRPANSTESLILVVEVGGLTFDEFSDVARSSRIVWKGPGGGDFSIPPEITRVSRVQGDDATLLVAATVPRSAEQFEIRIDGHGVVRFEAPALVLGLEI